MPWSSSPVGSLAHIRGLETKFPECRQPENCWHQPQFRPARRKFRDADDVGKSVDLNFPQETKWGKQTIVLPAARIQTGVTAGLESGVRILKSSGLSVISKFRIVFTTLIKSPDSAQHGRLKELDCRRHMNSHRSCIKIANLWQGFREGRRRCDHSDSRCRLLTGGTSLRHQAIHCKDKTHCSHNARDTAEKKRP